LKEQSPSNPTTEIKLETVTINITEEKLTEKQLKKYREGRVKAALAE
jgi:hypothetical protein